MKSNFPKRNQVESPDGFVITSAMECGHGISTLASDGVVEVEIIAHSKNSRYLCVKISALRTCQARLRIVPDRQFKTAGFERFDGWLWLRNEGQEQWRELDKSELSIDRSRMSVTLNLQQGQEVTLTSEIPLPYSQTCEFLRGLEGKQQFRRVQIGASVEGRPIYCLQRLSPTKGKPLLLVIAGEHGSEFAGEFVARGMLSAVLEESPRGEGLRENFDWGFILNANPDGNVNGWHQYNATDWNKHSYPFPSDISWHHEYASFLIDGCADVAPEAKAIGGWVLANQPSFLFNAHSWEGHSGNIGAFRATASLENYPDLIATIDETARTVAGELGVLYHDFNAGNPRSGHLGDTLAALAGIPSLTPEAHMRVGRENLGYFGYEWLRRSLNAPIVVDTLQKIASEVKERYDRLCPVS